MRQGFYLWMKIHFMGGSSASPPNQFAGRLPSKKDDGFPPRPIRFTDFSFKGTEMKTYKIIAAAALAIVAATGAQAQTSEGALQFYSTRSRAEVQAEAAQAARTGFISEIDYPKNTPSEFTSHLDRSVVRAEAAQAARAGFIPDIDYPTSVPTASTSLVDRSVVRAGAIAAAHARENIQGYVN
jgi:hypothetical protein